MIGAESIDGLTTDQLGAGILTFLIADVRGYTAFTQAYGDEAGARLTDRFDRVVETVAETWNGRTLELQGDEALVAFSSVRQAVQAAVDLQERCAAETLQDPSLPLHVGVGLDVGESVRVRDDYRGSVLNVAARLCSIARSGYVYSTTRVANLAQRVDGLVFVDRGEVQLKGLAAPVTVMQVCREGQIPPDAPRFSVHVPKITSLPRHPTPFVGREHEVVDLSGMLLRDETRMLTLSGPGGIGKTRLAIEVGSDLAHSFADGVVYVQLASLVDPELVPSAVAGALGLQETGTQPLIETIEEYLRDKRALLLLDNFEHLLAAAPVVSQLLDGPPDVKLLVTSRSVLRLMAEYTYDVRPLALPESANMDVNALAQVDSIVLFLRRARAAKPAFQMTDENAAIIAAICLRLDGLPLAIELAAARVRLLPPAALLSHLDGAHGHTPLRLLTGGARDLPARQQTLRATIDWSYQLLEPDEQQLFADLSVFSGGCTYDAVEAIAGGADASGDVLDGLTSLADKSLIRQENDDDPRFVMLETIREYAAERLTQSGREDQARSLHADFYIALAERADPEMRGPDQAAWLRVLEAEHDNFRGVLRWSLERKDSANAMRLGAALWRFWWTQGHFTEGRRWLEAMLALPAAPAASRARALSGAGNLAWSQGDYARAMHLHEESLALRRELGDGAGVAISLSNLGAVAHQQGDYAAAAGFYGQALEAARQQGDRWGTAAVLGNLGFALMQQGEYDQAVALCEESLELWGALGDQDGASRVLNTLGLLALARGDFATAEDRQQASLRIARDLRQNENVAACLEGLAGVAAARGDAERVVRLAGAAEETRRQLSQRSSPAEQAEQERLLERARAQLGSGFDAAWREGQAMTISQAIAYALAETR